MKQPVLVLTILSVATFLQADTHTEIQYLSGRGSDAPVAWDFKVSKGRQAGQWTTIGVPCHWELQGFGTYNYGHDLPKADEQGHYRHRFTVPSSWQGQRIIVVFEGAMTDTDVKINGQSAGPVHQGGFYRFGYDIADKLFYDRENVLEVVVSKMSANESINQAERKSDYWVFGGIYRPVYLKAVPRENIDWTAIDARADGRFRMDVYLDGVRGADCVEAQMMTRTGSPLGESFTAYIGNSHKVTLETRVSSQKNWSAETPHLYFVDVTLKQGDRPIHTVRERFGFRTVEVREGQGVFLNGRPIVLKGCNRHSFWPTTGRALSRNHCLNDVLLMKEMNMNAVRMSHYPPDTWFLDLCDEYGLYVLDELAGWQKPPYDTPTAKRLVKQMVKRDVNHACILFWDNGNEGGWNTAVDDDFAKYDPQQRRVLHPWGRHGGIDTDHYENYASTAKKLQADHIFMPTEYLHGLYDGGHGAGLEDYWDLMWGHPLTAGMFLWVFADEGVVRTDQNGRIDTDGNHAPDGIVGPFHEREASFYTIKEIWSPIYIDSNRKIDASFKGVFQVENRYDFTNLNQCRFTWQLIDYAPPQGVTTTPRIRWQGGVDGPDLPARETGKLQLNLPTDWRHADALVLTAFDPDERELFTWKWPIVTKQRIVKSMVEEAGPSPSWQRGNDSLEVTAGAFRFSFDQKNGQLQSVWQGAHLLPFTNGPVYEDSKIEAKEAGVEIRVDERVSNLILDVKHHPHLQTFRWTVHGSGWLQLDYSYNCDKAVDYLGVSFDYPEERMLGMKWLGKGPYRVWKNRMKGPTIDVWSNTYKNFKPNTAWDYPEFVGYFADLHWAVFDTLDGAFTVATDTDDLFMKVYAQEDGYKPRTTKMVWPQGDLSFLHAIPAIGTKFKAAYQYGPMSQKFKASGAYSARLYFYFGLPEGD